ncbi:MAG: hypothetical protein WC975_01530 [Phycisphaerae bacterium]
MINATDFQFKGAWWHSPSILEPMPGPWAGYEIFGLDVVEAWKRILDWHKNHGMDGIITQISSHFKDRTLMGWGFQYVLDFDRHPEARTFGLEFVRRNRRRMEQILEHADKLGVKMYIHHYNFMAPKTFVEAHPAIHAKWKIITNQALNVYMANSRAICDRIGTLYGNLCWREPVYQEFMKDLWDELFAKFPSLAGVLTTPGENQYCLCPDCTRGARSYEGSELLRARNANANEFIGHFCGTFREAMAKNGKQGIFRLWGVKRSADERIDTSIYPRDIPYMIKYHWFDNVDAGPDPLIADWIGRGFRVWVSHDLWGENAGPVAWNRPAYIRRFVDECRRLGVEGIVSHQNNDWGTAGIPGWVQGLNLKSYCRCLAGSPDSDTDWIEKEYLRKFGPVGPRIQAAIEQYSDFVFNITKLVIIGGEGYTFGLPHPLYPGVGRIGNRVDDWVRGDLGEIADYIEYARAHGWPDDLFRTLYMADRDPFRRLERMRDSAARAVEELDKIKDEAPSESLGEYEWITTSARLCLHQAQEYWHLCRVAVLRAAWIGETRPTVRGELAQRVLEEMEQALAAVHRIREDLLELQTASMDFARILRCRFPIANDGDRMFYLPSRENEYEQLKREMKGSDV